MATPRVLVIAGSDSSGGAGLEADQKVLAAHGVYAQTVTTALTAQNTLGVNGVHVTPPEFVGMQIDACLSDIGCDVVKMGMLAEAATIEIVADKLAEWKVQRVVLDPVMVSTSGAQLLPVNAVKVLLARLVKNVELVTPNVPEGVLMLKEGSNIDGGHEDEVEHPVDLEGLKRLAEMIFEKLEPKAILLKGGHVPLMRDGSGKLVKATKDEERQVVVDILYDGKSLDLVESEFTSNRNTHGTGCSLASAIAANLALGDDLSHSVRKACRYVGVGIKTSVDIGKGSGPINHFHNVQRMPFVEGNFLEYLLSRDDVARVWEKYTHHPFAERMGDGTLPIEDFKDYLVQDYLYLTHFARTNALAAYKSTSMDTIAASAQIVLHIEREMNLHLDYCASFGISKEDILKNKESLACVAYSRYVLDIGQSQDWLALQMSLAPCLLGYAIVAKRLSARYGKSKEVNRYWKWIENYTANDYQEAVEKGSALIEDNIVKQSPSRIDELAQIFVRATEMEVEFWNFGAHWVEK